MDNWQKFIDELKAKSEIVDVIGSYARLDKRGNSFWACCPFHNERQPSFSVSKNGQFYKCFGCGVSGDVINFVMEIESTDFMGAVEILAARAGMELPVRGTDNGDDLIREKSRKLQEYKRIMLLTAKYYAASLFESQGEIGLEYLTKKRGLDRKTIKHFGLGYAPYKGVANMLIGNGVQLDDAEECGIVSKKDGGYSDFFGGRVMFPIINAQREVIAFGGRRLDGENFGKYTNTKKTPLFDKSRCLYNANNIKKLKQAHGLDYLILVEGYMDVVSMYAHGVENVIAGMGTSLTEGQARQIKRYSNNVYICYDGDSAGADATQRGLDILQNEGLNVRVVSLPDKLDPDETLLQKGYSGFARCIDDALPLVDYKLKVIRDKYDLKADNGVVAEENRRKFTNEAIAALRKCADEVVREALTVKIAEESGFEVSFIRKCIADNLEIQPTQLPRMVKMLSKEEQAESFVCSVLLSECEYAQPFIPQSGDDTLRIIFDYIAKQRENREALRKEELFELVKDIGSTEILQEVLDRELKGDKNEIAYYNDCLSVLKRRDVQRQINKLTEEVGEATDTKTKLELIAQIGRLQKQLA
ncbi:MAG: DNA primase [Clostridia bacterium]|nr:DNA primase [Clostridia bacterium]